MIRLCSRCKRKRELDLTNFYKDKQSSDGFRRECKDCTKKEQLNYINRPVVRFSIYKRDALKRGLVWDLTLNDFESLRHTPCKYCGEFKKLSGIDRVANNLGYTTSNTVACCEWCNRMKWKYSEIEFLDRCNSIVRRLLKS
jgi:hypothetical protein